MTYRANIRNTDQSDWEVSEFKNGIPVFAHQKTRVIVKADGGSECVAHSPVANKIYSNAGVVMNHSDVAGRFLSDQVGRG